MKKNLVVIFVLCLVIVSSNFTRIKASSGRLKGASITSCNGVDYGHHGDGHWHEAVNRGGYWYPVGDNLGYDNPCSGGYESEPEAQSEPEPRGPSAEEVEAQRLEDIRVTEEQARLEEERKAQEIIDQAEVKRLEELALEETRLEEVKQNDVTIAAPQLEHLQFDETSTKVTPLKMGEYKNIAVLTTNKNASSTIALMNNSKAFTENTLIVSVVSENAKSTHQYSYALMELGTNEELLEQEIWVNLVNDNNVEKIIELKDGYLNFGEMSESEVNGLKIKSISINKKEILLETNASLIKVSDSENSHVLNVTISGLEYAIKANVEDPKLSTGSVVGGGVVLSGAVAGAVVLRKKKSAKLGKA